MTRARVSPRKREPLGARPGRGAGFTSQPATRCYSAAGTLLLLEMSVAESERDTGLFLPEERSRLLARLRRVEGQVRGIQGMIERGETCADILTQVSSTMAALQNTGMLILEGHVKDCVRDAAGREDEALIAELVQLLMRFTKAGPVARD